MSALAQTAGVAAIVITAIGLLAAVVLFGLAYTRRNVHRQCFSLSPPGGQGYDSRPAAMRCARTLGHRGRHRGNAAADGRQWTWE